MISGAFSLACFCSASICVSASRSAAARSSPARPASSFSSAASALWPRSPASLRMRSASFFASATRLRASSRASAVRFAAAFSEKLKEPKENQYFLARD